MNEFTISVVQDPSTIININNLDQTTSLNIAQDQPNLIQVQDDINNVLLNPSVFYNGINIVYLSGVSGELLHNTFGDLQGGITGQYYHLSSGQYFNLTTGSVVRPSETGQFYLNSNPSGFITGVNLSNYATITYVTGISGELQAKITLLNNQTGSYVLYSETGKFYSNNNPSGFITGINNVVFTTGNQVISGSKTFTGSFNVSTHDPIIIRSTGYAHGIEIGGFYYNQFGNGGFVNSFGVGGTENHFGDLTNSSNSFGGNANQNDFGSYAALNNYYGGLGIGQFDFDTRPTVNGTGVLLEGEIPDTGYLTGYINKNETGDFYPRTNPSGYITGVDLSFSGNYYTKNESESKYVNTTGTETILGNKTFHDNVYINNLYVTGLETVVNTTNTNVASNYIMLNLTGGAVDGGIFFVTGSGLTGVNDSGAIIGFDHSDKFKFGISTRASDLSTLSTIASFEQVTGISGGLQTQISTLNNQTGTYVFKTETGNFITNSQTGQFYPNSNPSGFITGIDLSSYATQVYVASISGDLQAQVTDLTNATGSYILNSQTGQFYANSNPSGFITGINNLVYTTGDQTISGIKTFATGVNISGDVGIGTSSPSEKLEVIGSISADSSSNTYTLQNKNTSVLQSAFERVRGWLVWSYNSSIGRLKTADISAARDWLLPNSSGTIPITTLTDGSVSAEETFRTALYREMMWMALQTRKLFGTLGAAYGTNSSGSGANNTTSAATGGNGLVGTVGSKGVGVWETGMSAQPGQGASWKIPTSFSASGYFYSLLVSYTSTSSNITSGLNTFLLNGGASNANNNFLVGNRIWNANFPDGTRITSVSGQTITVDKVATSNGGANSSIVSCYDGINRLVLGTTNNITTFNAQCCNAIPTTTSMLVAGGYASGATQITVTPPITFTASGTAGTTFITATATPTGVVTGMIVSGNGIPANAIVTSVAGTQINLNVTLAINVTSISVGFAPTMIAYSTSAMGPAVYIASGTGGNNFITLTTTPIGFSAGYIVSGNGITAGTTITSIVGNQVNLSTTLAGNVSNIAVTFMASNAFLTYAYGYGIPDNTRISSITSSTTTSNIIINLSAAVTGDTRYGTGLVGQVGTPFVYTTGATTASVSNNAIFIEYRPNPSTGKVEIRMGYQRAGRMFYSSFAQLPEGAISETYNHYIQFILDYSSVTNTLRLWANRNTTDFSTVPSRPLQSNVLLSLAVPSDLVTCNTNIYWGVQSCDDGVKPPFNQNMNSITWRDAVYYPFTLAV